MTGGLHLVTWAWVDWDKRVNGNLLCFAVQVPGAAQNLVAQANSATSITVIWQEPHSDNGPINNYKLYYMENGAGSEQVSWTHQTLLLLLESSAKNNLLEELSGSGRRGSRAGASSEFLQHFVICLVSGGMTNGSRGLMAESSPLPC